MANDETTTDRTASPPYAMTKNPEQAGAVIEVKGLKTYLFTRSGIIKAVDDVSFSLRRGETLAVVGESGCGKSMTALSIMRLVPDPPGRIVGGTITLEGRDLLQLDEAEMRDVRGNDISMIFQEPMTSLNPVLTIGHQITEALRLHQDLSKSAAAEKAVEMLRLAKNPPPAGAGISASAGGRDAAAGDDRHGARLQPASADRRRADDRFGCYDPGADPRP